VLNLIQRLNRDFSCAIQSHAHVKHALQMRAVEGLGIAVSSVTPERLRVYFAQ